MASLAPWLAEAIERHRQSQEAYTEMAGPLWVVRLDEPAEYLYGQQRDIVDVAACVMNMRRRVGLAPTTEDGLWRLEPCAPMVYATKEPCPLERIAAPECSMKAVMACVRRSGLHGAYYKTPEARIELIKGEQKFERKEYRF